MGFYQFFFSDFMVNLSSNRKNQCKVKISCANIWKILMNSWKHKQDENKILGFM